MMHAYLLECVACIPSAAPCLRPSLLGPRVCNALLILCFVQIISPLHLHHISTISPEVARELEDPFIHPPNEAPLVAVQQSFNARLLSGWGFPVLFQPL